jgi:hypothetical protein
MCRKVVALALALTGLLALAGCSAAPASEGSSPAAAPAVSPATPPQEQANLRKIGETVTMATVKFTVKGVRFSPGDGETKADEGSLFAIAEVAVENTGKAVFYSNTLVQYNARTAQGLMIDRTAIPDVKQGLDAEVEPGATATGEIAFLVPGDAKGLKLEFLANLLNLQDRVVVLLGDVQ